MLRLLELLKPDMFMGSVAEVDLDDLERRGIQGLLLDIDNTLVAWRKCNVPVDIREWIEEAHRRGFKMCLTSNTRNNRRLERLAGELKMSFVRGVVKPRRGGFAKAMGIIGTVQSNTAVIGDQVFTDVLGGNRAGLFTILVKPLNKREFLGTKVSRLAERLLFGWIRRRGMTGTIPNLQASDREDET